MADDPDESRPWRGADPAHDLDADSEVEHTVTTGGARLKADATLSLQPGALLDARYQIEAVIGEGGSGQVFRAWDRVLGEPVAVKILHPSRAAEKSWIKRLARDSPPQRLPRVRSRARGRPLVRDNGAGGRRQPARDAARRGRRRRREETA